MNILHSFPLDLCCNHDSNLFIYLFIHSFIHFFLPPFLPPSLPPSLPSFLGCLTAVASHVAEHGLQARGPQQSWLAGSRAQAQ